MELRETQRTPKSMAVAIGGKKKVGDLVRYSGCDFASVLGIVIKTVEASVSHSGASTVQWANGITSNHSNKWLIKVKTSEDR